MKILSIVLLGLLSINNSFAMPLGKANALKIHKKGLTGLDPNYDFNGIVKLSDCSGSIIKFSGMPDSAKAIALTNGHCIGDLIPPNTAINNQPVKRSMEVYSRDQQLVPVVATKVLYATMTNTDITLYELKSTYAELTKKGVDAFELDTNHPTLGTSIDIVSGYWDNGYRCNIDTFIYQLRESDWTWKDSIRYTDSGCETIGGTSGSPIIQTGTRSVIGVNNTGNDSGERCTMDNPCEVDEHGNIEVKIHASYGQETYNIYSCLSLDFRIDLTKPGCELFK